MATAMNRTAGPGGARLPPVWQRITAWFRRTPAEERAKAVNGRTDLDLMTLLEFLGIDPTSLSVRGTGALKEATVYACIKILSEAVGKLPLKVYQEGERGHRKATEHQLYRLLKYRPNPHMTTSQFLRLIEVHRNVYGNAYALIWRGRGNRILGLYPLDPAQVTVYVDDLGIIGDENRVWYEVGPERRRFSQDDILHLKAMTTDGLVGIAPLDYLRYLAENGAAATRFINQFYRQGLATRGIVQYVGELNAEARERFRREFEELSAGLKNAHRIAMLPIGFQFQPLQITMADAQFLENTELTIRQIAAAFGVKMHQLGDLSRATHTNIEQQNRQFYADTLQAILTDYEQEFTWKLFTEEELAAGYYVKFNVDSLVRSDLKTRYEAYRTGVQGGFLMPNEVRALEELPPVEGGDQLLVNGNMIPITMAGQQYVKGGGQPDDQGEAEPEPAVARD